MQFLKHPQDKSKKSIKSTNTKLKQKYADENGHPAPATGHEFERIQAVQTKNPTAQFLQLEDLAAQTQIEVQELVMPLASPKLSLAQEMSLAKSAGADEDTATDLAVKDEGKDDLFGSLWLNALALGGLLAGGLVIYKLVQNDEKDDGTTKGLIAVTVGVSDDNNNGKPEVTGLATPSSTVTIIWPDGSSNTVIADTSGAYLLEASKAFSDGTVTASGKDSSGNTSGKVTDYFKDMTAPITPITKLTDEDRDGMPEVVGSAEAGSTVTIQWPNGSSSTVKADTNGKYKIESLTVQPQGTVTSTAKDLQGNTSESEEIFYTITTPTSPTVTVVDPGTGKPTITGVTDPLSTVTIIWPDKSTITTTTDSNGEYKITSPTVQPEGSVTATTTGVTGNTSTPTDEKYTDKVNPSKPSIAVSDPDLDKKPDVTGTAEPLSKVTLTWPDGSSSTTQTNSQGLYKFESPLTQLAGSVTATATDINNNSSAPVSGYYNPKSTDPTAPTVTVVDPGTGKPTITGVTDPLSTVTIVWPDKSTITTTTDSNGEYKITSPTVQPEGSVTATTTGVTGNTSTPTDEKYTDKVNPSKPSIAVSDPDLDKKPDVTGTAEPLSKVTLTWPDGSSSTTQTNSQGLYKFESPLTQLAGSVTATATDINNNSSAPVSGYYNPKSTDPTAPTVTVVDPGTGKPTITGVTDPLSTVTIIWPDKSTITTTTDSNGEYKITSPTVQPEGSVTATTTGVTGNTSTPTDEKYTDKVNPSKPSIAVSDPDLDKKPDVTGTAEPLSKVTLTWPDGSSSTTQTNSQGLYKFESPLTQLAGSVTATATDINNNSSAPVSGYYNPKSTDPTAPTVTVVDPGTGKPTITGVTDPLSTVTIIWPDKSTITTTTDSNGEYKITSPTVQPEGSVTATTTGVTGNTSTPTDEKYTDKVNPSKPSIAVSDPDLDKKPDVTGTAEPLSKVTLTWPDGSSSTTQTNSQGLYKFESPLTQLAGSVTATATDINNNSSAPVSGYYNPKSTDPTAPTVTVVDPGTGIPQVTGTAEPLSTVTLTWPTGVTSTTATNSEGIYKTVAPTVQPEGTVTATTTAITGNSSTPAEGKYTDEKSPNPPTITVTDPNNDGKPDAVGTAEPLSTVTLTWPSGVTSTVQTDSKGIYKAIAPTVQPEGTVTATTTDLNGNSSVPAEGKYTDEKSPNPPTITVTDPNNDGKPDAVGTAEPLSTVTLTWPSGVTSTVQTDSKGIYKAIAPTVQPEGTVTATTIDLNGNSSVPAEDLYTDDQNPNPPTVIVTDPAIVTGPGTGIPQVTGTAEPLSTVTLTWPTGVTSTTLTNSEGIYKTVAPTVQPEGTVTATTTAITGNSSTPAEGKYTDEKSPNPPTITAIDIDSDGKPEAKGTAEPFSTVRLTWPNGEISTALTNSKGDYQVESQTVQPEGSVTATATDLNGNSSSEVAAKYTDIYTPATPTITATDPDADNMPTATGTAEPNSKVIVTWPDGSSISTTATATGTYSVESLTTQTSGTVKAVSVDAAGNSSPDATGTYTDTTASTAPTITATDPDADNMPTATGTAEPNSKVIVTWPDGSSISTTATATGTYTVESLTTQTNGTVKAVSVDAAGNSSPDATGTYTDTTASTAPTITATDPDADNMPTATGTAEPNSKVIVTWPDGSSISTTATATGTYTVESLTKQTSGTVKAVSVDAAGNSSPDATGIYTDMTASTAPTITATDPDADNMPTATGTAEPNSKVIVTWPDGSSISTTATATGTYTVESLTKQTSGTVKAVSVDAAGNSSPDATGTYTDTTASTAPTITATDPDADNMPTATGTAEPNSKVIVTWPDGSSISTTATATGTYTVESLTKQTSGTVKAVSVDAAGNSSPVATGTYTDTTASTAPTITATDPDADNMPTATGTAEPNSKVIVTWPDGSSISTTATATGTYSVESLTTQTSGTVKAVSVDAAGNSSPDATGIYTDMTASTAPTITATDPDADNMPTATGTAEPNSKVIVTWPDGSSISTTATATGTYSVESLTTQTSGTVKAVSVDAAGNSSPDATGIYTDMTASTAPTITATDPDADNMPTATGTAEPNSKVIVTWPDGSSISTTATATGTYTVESLTKQTSGTVKAVSVDAAGNSSPDATGTYTDTTASTAPTITATDPDADNMPTATGTAEPNSKVIVTWPDGSSISTTATATGTYTVESLTKQTSGTVKAVSVDAAGNSSPVATGTYTDTTASTAPTITATDPDADNMPTATGTAEPNSKVIVTWPDGSSISTTATATGTYTVESLTKQTSGTVKAVSVDAAGNSSPVATGIYTDMTVSTAPTITATDPDADNMPTATGTAEPNSKVIVTWPDGSSISTTATATGTYSVESLTTQTSGTVKAVSVDAAGNSSPVATGTYTDTTAPNQPLMLDMTDASDLGVSSSDDMTTQQQPNYKLVTPLKAGETAQLFIDGVKVDATYNSVDQTLTPVLPLSFGNHDVQTLYIDQAGNTSALSVANKTTIYQDGSITITEPIAGDNLIVKSETPLVVSGVVDKVPSGQVVTVVFKDTSGNSATATGTVDATGKWTASAANVSGLSDGNIDIQASVSNTSGMLTDAATARLNLATVALTTIESDTVSTDTFTDPFGTDPSGMLGESALFTMSISNSAGKSVFLAPSVGNSGTIYMPTGGAGSTFVTNLMNNTSILAGNTTKVVSKLGTFTALSFIYADASDSQPRTIEFYTAAGGLIKSQSLAARVGSGGVFNSGTLSQPAAYFLIKSGDNYLSMDNMTLTLTTPGQITTGNIGVDTTPLIKGTVSRNLLADEKIQVLRDNVAVGDAVVTGTDWRFTDNAPAGQHTYTAAIVRAGTIEVTSSNNKPLNIKETPLVLDLNGDGVHTLSQEAGVHFDINADGSKDQLGWVDQNDGLLVLDLNMNGIVDDGRELFGNHMLKASGSEAENGWDALRSYDSNEDGVINDQDQAWATLKVWQDQNSNGQTDQGELFAVMDLGILQIGLSHGLDQTLDNNNVVAMTGLMTGQNGKQHVVADVFFDVTYAQSFEGDQKGSDSLTGTVII